MIPASNSKNISRVEILARYEQFKSEHPKARARDIASSDNRRYLLLDEPTASLDLKQAQIVMRILRKAADEGLGIIVILHDLASTRRYADKAFVLKEGTVDVCGSPIECLTKENISKVFDIDLTTAEDSLHEVI